MGSRLELHEILVNLLGSNNVYYQPPESVKMSYTAIRYTKEKISKVTANDGTYRKLQLYQLIVISKRPDDPVIEKILELPYSTHNRHYVAENLHHDILSLYF